MNAVVQVSRVFCKRPIRGSLLAAILALAIGVYDANAAQPVFPKVAISDGGRYRVLVKPASDVVPIAEFHNWIVFLETADGDVFVPSRMGITAGMPAHGHGMTSDPLATRRLDDGSFVIEGMNFHMAGEWVLMVGVDGPEGVDTVSFELTVGASSDNVDASISNWSESELAVMQSLSISRLELKRDPTNRFSGNPNAADLGRELFFDKDLSATGTVSCATCHQPDRAFTDGLAKSFGTNQTGRNAPTLVGVSHNQWYYWDGRRDSLWAQAITPPESLGEMDNNRMDVVRMVARKYGDAYVALTGDTLDERVKNLPVGAGPFADSAGKSSWNRMTPAERRDVNLAFANIGKFLAAYVETLQPTSSRFDAFVERISADGYPAARELLSEDEQRGLKLFLDGARTQCLRCHNGPLFTNHSFHNIATGVAENGVPDFGRMIGLQSAQLDEFNCRGEYSDAPPSDCVELRYTGNHHIETGAFKVPGLRNVSETAPYMHDGRFSTLEEVVEFYTDVPGPEAGDHELPALELSVEEVGYLAAFMRALTSESTGRSSVADAAE